MPQTGTLYRWTKEDMAHKATRLQLYTLALFSKVSALSTESVENRASRPVKDGILERWECAQI